MTDETTSMSFKAALQKLNIEDYEEKIFCSNSRGELFHILDYIEIAECFEDCSWFREWFLEVVTFANKNNPAQASAVYQHIGQILRQSIKAQRGGV